ncbi:hypothetical protein [Mariniflexile sp. AS56]|uniref:hypothetical protein n=1 Tax=Mariniflexile sp. AS56 TaxID=3063957 RepID=UPI0026EFFB4E|nr:hypothetical protein [Mariniflexile sp. AS56]MDO7171513.1 hypothetical protein [Mariniflexile sp. AS56]
MNVALIEFNNYHQECIYSQVKFLKTDHSKVTLIINPKSKNLTASYSHLIDETYYYDKKASFSFIKKLFLLFKLYRFIVQKKFDKIIFNTASSSKTIIFITLLLKFSDVECIGTIHNLKKMGGSFSQKLLNIKIKKYFVLNDFLLSSHPIKNTEIRLNSYYPIFFPDYKTCQVNKPTNEIWISIPGEVNFKRRDYSIVIESLLKTTNSSHLKFIILGKINAIPKDGEVFLELLSKHGLKTNFITFDAFVENDLFFSYLKASDYILANLQLNDNSYLKYKISGVLNLAFGLDKRLIAPSKLNIIKDLEENTLFYDSSEGLSKLLSNNLQTEKDTDFILNKMMDYKVQQKKYIDFINS